MSSKNVGSSEEGRQAQQRSLDDTAVHLGVRGLFAMEEVAPNAVDGLDEVWPISRDRLSSVQVKPCALWLKVRQSSLEVALDALTTRNVLIQMDAVTAKLLRLENWQQLKEPLRFLFEVRAAGHQVAEGRPKTWVVGEAVHVLAVTVLASHAGGPGIHRYPGKNEAFKGCGVIGSRPPSAVKPRGDESMSVRMQVAMLVERQCTPLGRSSKWTSI
jgi:hypothetical protein